ncbi:MAG: type II toxin-antitoxin system RelE/ParE family toxin [Candidatus Blackburnbacteria bacterium]|nr:type II toxin-antitoxin system RelE/ParE family toxin [Candidatus Blackburnbacteria bacterium]
MRTKDLRLDLVKYLKKRRLENKFQKQFDLLLQDFRHPSLHTEILEPKYRKIYSFRIDQKYRAIFIVKEGKILIIDINDHYQ